MKSTMTAAAVLLAGAALVAAPAAAQYRPGSPNNTMSGNTPPGPPTTANDAQPQPASPAALASNAGNRRLRIEALLIELPRSPTLVGACPNNRRRVRGVPILDLLAVQKANEISRFNAGSSPVRHDLALRPGRSMGGPAIQF